MMVMKKMKKMRNKDEKGNEDDEIQMMKNEGD
jgi:hypothetical protein